MRLEKASYKAIKYACLNFHYAKSIPLVQCAYSVFNDKNEWCGVICYSIGATNAISLPYGLSQGQVIELVRVALNGKQGVTSMGISKSLKLLKNSNPLVKLVVSYADGFQNHLGVIYQAANWFYTGSTKAEKIYKHNGKQVHARWVSVKGWKYNTNGTKHKCIKPEECEIIMGKPKYKYIYPLDKSLIQMCKVLSKPYPKKCDNSITANAAAFQVAEEGQHHLIAQSKCDKIVMNG